VPGLIKRGKVWYSDIRLNGRRVRKPLSTDKVVAQQKLRDLSDERHSVKYGAGGDMRWGPFKEKYLAFCLVDKKPFTVVRTKVSLGHYEKFAKPKTLSDVTPETLEQFKGHRKAQGIGNATINVDVKKVKALMRRAMLWGYIDKWNGAAVKELRETRNRERFYTVEELKRLLDVCRAKKYGFYQWETVCLLAAQAGLRRSEIYHLAWKDIDLESGMLHVSSKEGWDPKTDKSSRHIPIAKDLAKHLKGLKRSTPWVIGERPSKSVMSAYFQKISRKARLDGNLHTLRHTFGSHLAQAGVPLHTIAKLMGHSTTRTTELYAHLAPKDLKSAISRLPGIGL